MKKDFSFKVFFMASVQVQRNTVDETNKFRIYQNNTGLDVWGHVGGGRDGGGSLVCCRCCCIVVLCPQ